MRVVGLIPARGGSKGIPRKNLVPLAGKPLIRWTVDEARRAERLADVVVSTDDEEIAAVAACATVRRPPELAADDTPMLAVVVHALGEVEADAICVLQPTSPLRRAEHIDAAVELLEATGADGVVSVVPVPHRYLPSSQMRLTGDRLEAVDPAAPTLRQAKATLYARNGPAVLVVRTAGLRERGLYGGDLRAFPMSEGDSLDVDTPLDLQLCAALLERTR